MGGLRGDFTSTRCTSKSSGSTSIRSRMRSSRSFWMPPTITQRCLNFLRDWKDGSFPAGWDNKPVTWVSLEDARAYASGQESGCPMSGNGNTRRRAPTAALIHGVTNGMPVPYPFRTGPHHARSGCGRCSSAGASPFGVMDLVGKRLAVDGGVSG